MREPGSQGASRCGLPSSSLMHDNGGLLKHGFAVRAAHCTRHEDFLDSMGEDLMVIGENAEVLWCWCCMMHLAPRRTFAGSRKESRTMPFLPMLPFSGFVDWIQMIQIYCMYCTYVNMAVMDMTIAIANGRKGRA